VLYGCEYRALLGEYRALLTGCRAHYFFENVFFQNTFSCVLSEYILSEDMKEYMKNDIQNI